jgi:hypothetical protein
MEKKVPSQVSLKSTKTKTKFLLNSNAKKYTNERLINDLESLQGQNLGPFTKNFTESMTTVRFFFIVGK